SAPRHAPSRSSPFARACQRLKSVFFTGDYLLYFRILAAAGATNLLLVTLLIPVVALLLGAAVLGERLAPRQLAGMALIALGLAATDGRLLALARPR
ncbi:MAG TPA: EamA family transporter, partial [Methylomirabilota bacterium]|nr:EamA family transporter [Methylomirabilota bacterium]